MQSYRMLDKTVLNVTVLQLTERHVFHDPGLRLTPFGLRLMITPNHY